jgi:outer membrane protein assembly factor BamB
MKHLLFSWLVALAALALGLPISRAADPADAPKVAWENISDSVVATLAAESKKPGQAGPAAGVACDPTTGDVYMLITEQGLWKSADHGANFQRVDNKTISGRCETGYALDVNPAGKAVAVFPVYGSAALTTDAGKTWQKSKEWHIDSIALDWDSLTLLALKHESGGNLIYSADAAKSWTSLGKGYSAMGLFDPKTLVASKGKGILRSTDAGKTWDSVSELKPTGQAMRVRNGIGYWLAADGLLISKDKGLTWSLLGTSIKATMGPWFGKDATHLIVLSKQGISESTDDAKTWKLVTPLPPKFDGGLMTCLAYDSAADIFYISHMTFPTYRYNRGIAKIPPTTAPATQKSAETPGGSPGLGLSSLATATPDFSAPTYFIAAPAPARTAAQSSDWPQWRGPTGQGFVTTKGLPTQWDAKTGKNVLWSAPLPKCNNPFSSPIVAGGKVFLTYAIDKTREHHVLCFDAATGKQIWDTPIEPGPWKMTDLRGGYADPTPVSDGDHVYVVFGSAVMACLDLSGQILWRHELESFAFDVAIGDSPILYNNMVLFVCDQNNRKSNLLALDKATGKVLYQQPRPEVGGAHSTPLLADIAGTPELLVSANNRLQGVDPATGKVLWFCKSTGDSACPVYSGGLVCIDSGRGGPLIAVAPPSPTGSGDISKTHLKWTFKGRVGEGLGSPIIVGDYVYRAHDPSTVHCFKLATGESLFEEKLPGLSAWSSPIATPEGLIYFVTAGKSFILHAADKLDLVATNDLNDGNSAPSPAVANNKLYIRGNSKLFCIGTK